VRDVQCYWCISQFASTPRFEGIDREIERQTDNVPCDSSSSSSMVMSNDRCCSCQCSELVSHMYDLCSASSLVAVDGIGDLDACMVGVRVREGEYELEH
jgi:hypothetical protein